MPQKEKVMTTQPQVRDVMQFVNEQDAATLERFIERLELRGTDPTFVAYREAYLELIDLPRATAVLDLGCGTGVVARAIAARDGFAGTVTGIDQSADFIAVAETLAADEGVGDRVQFAVGDAHGLGFPDASFDAAVAHTLVSHVRDPLAVLAEAARVVRPGGSVAIFDADFASLTFGCSDARLGELVEPALRATNHELATRHARAPSAATQGRAAADRHTGARLRGRRVEHADAQPGRDLRATGDLDRTGVGRARRCLARRSAPLCHRRHLLRRLQLLRLRRPMLTLRREEGR